MNVLFVGLASFQRIINATELELMLKKLNQGDVLFSLSCTHSLQLGCGTQLNTHLSRCTYCVLERKLGAIATGLNKQVRHINVGGYKSFKNSTATHKINIKDMDELKKVKSPEGYDIGMSIASLIISSIGDTSIDIDESLKNLINDYYWDITAFGRFIEFVINKFSIESLYICNGRLPYQRIALRVGNQMGIPVTTYESAPGLNKYQTFENVLPHDLKYQKEKINEFWNTNSYTREEKEIIASEWFDSRIQGKDVAGINYTLMQDKQKIPYMNHRMKNIVIFNSTELEIAAVNEEYTDTIYRDQNDALNQILRFSDWDDNVKFYLRVHPNLNSVNSEQTRFISNIQSDRMVVIPADSEISSYALMQQADLVLTFGSTIGMEACYQKKPLILAGRCIYEELDGIFKPSTHLELCNMINYFCKEDFNPMISYWSSIKYAWYMAMWGNSFEYFNERGYSDIVLKRGKNNPPTKLYNKLQNITSAKLQYTSRKKYKK